MTNKYSAKKRQSRIPVYSRKKKGGEAIAAGGFGCVFKPALLCKGKTTRGTGISKVLISKYADEEIAEITKVSKILKKIKNYDDYFVGLNPTSCLLEDLSASDKMNFDTKCNNLTKHGINASNVNSNLHKLKSIDVPYGGLEVYKFFSTHGITIDLFFNVNNSLIKLLKNAIVPMNQLKLFHLDLKAPNILIDNRYNARIIDWGLSGIQENVSSIPYAVKNRPFMYNGPITITVFEDRFKPYIKNVINRITSSLFHPIRSLNDIRDQIKYMCHEWIKRVNNDGYSGHYDYITKTLFKNVINVNYTKFPLTMDTNPKIKYDEINEFLYFNNYVSDALTEVIIKYTDLNGNFDDVRYFNEVYKHNVDVIGFISTYYDILLISTKASSINHLSREASIELSLNITNLINKYIFSTKYQANKIDLNELIKDLKSLSNFIHGRHSNVSSASPVPSPLSSTPLRVLTPPPTPFPTVIRSRGPSPIRVLSSSSIVVPPPRAKKTRKRHVTCDDAKKALCISKGKVCNDATGRCVAIK